MTTRTTLRPANSAQAVAVAALVVEFSGDVAPTEFRIIPAGEFRSWDGRPTECAAWLCTKEDGERIIADVASAERNRVVDYEHATLHAQKTGAKAPAAGWFKSLEWRDGDKPGVWVVGADWTKLAAQEIADKAYRYISPVFSYDKQTGHVLQLLHAALTNHPGLDGLTDLAALAAELLLPANPPENSMTLLQKLLAAIGLQETATEAEALAAVANLKTNVATLTAQAVAPDPARFVPVATLSALQGEHASLQEKFVALQAEIDAGKLDQVIADGKAAGKLTPATEAWARDLGKKDLASLSAYLESAPVVCKPGSIQSDGQERVQGTAALSADQMKVCELLGVAPADFQQTLSA